MSEYTTQEINQRVALLNQYERRCVIHFFQESETDHMPVGDVVSHPLKQDQTPDERDKIATELHHNHFPKLAAIDVLDFDSRSEAVRFYGDELVETLVKSTPETHIPGI